MIGTSLAIAIGASLSLLAAIATKALAEVSWHELEEYCRRRQRTTIFDQIHDRSESVIATTEILQLFGTLGWVGLVAIAWLPLDGSSEAGSLATAAELLLIVLIAVALTVWIPREVARCWAPEFLTWTWPLWQLADRLGAPLHAFPFVMRVVTRRLDGRATEWSEEEALEDEILSIVTEGQHDGLLEDDVREMIAGVIELDDTDVADIMTPRSEMDAIPIEMEWSEMLKFVMRVGRTRIPVYDKSLDDVIGLLYVKDLLAELCHGDESNRNLREILREVRQVPRSTRLDELLESFLNTRSHLAIVVDEFMHVVGLVTIEDVLEVIVGEIVDESDQEELDDIRWLDADNVEIQGRAHVEDVNETLGIELPLSPEYDTVGGLILHQLGRIPSEGESLQCQNLKITIQAATKRRIERVSMELRQKPKIIGVV